MRSVRKAAKPGVYLHDRSAAQAPPIWPGQRSQRCFSVSPIPGAHAYPLSDNRSLRAQRGNLVGSINAAVRTGSPRRCAPRNDKLGTREYRGYWCEQWLCGCCSQADHRKGERGHHPEKLAAGRRWNTDYALVQHILQHILWRPGGTSRATEDKPA